MNKKLIAPVIITILTVLILFGYLFGLLFFIRFSLGALLLALIPLSLAGVSVYVLWERIQEIRSGEEDDLSKY